MHFQVLLFTPLSLSTSTVAYLIIIDELVFIFVASGRFASLFERRQIEPLLIYPGKTWKLYIALLVPNLMLATSIGFSLIFSNPTVFSLQLSILIVIYSIEFILISAAISILVKSSTLNSVIISFLFLIPPLYLLVNSSSFYYRPSQENIAISSISPFSAIALLSNGQSALVFDYSIIYFTISVFLLLASILAIRRVDLI